MAKRPHPDDDPYQAIKKATIDAWAEAGRCVDEAVQAADLVRRTGGSGALDLFDSRATRALGACDRLRDWFESLREHVAKDRSD